MNEATEKGRGTTGQGRTSDPEPEELPEGCSVHGPSHRITKCFALPAIPEIAAFYLRVSQLSRFFIVLCQIALVDENLRLLTQPPGGSESVEAEGRDRPREVRRTGPSGEGPSEGGTRQGTTEFVCGGGAGGMAAVERSPSAGWRETAQAMYAEEGCSHE